MTNHPHFSGIKFQAQSIEDEGGFGVQRERNYTFKNAQGSSADATPEDQMNLTHEVSEI